MKKNRIPARSDVGILWRKILLMMKFVILFLFCAILQVQARVFSQQAVVNLKMQNVTLDKVFKELGKQANCDFLYSHSLIKTKGTVSVSAENQELSRLLDELLPGLGMSYSFDDNIVIIKERHQVLPQQKYAILTGIVKDSRGNVLPGVTVRIKGTTAGVSTDVNGKFEITLPTEQTVLQFSFVGMKEQEIAYTGQISVQVTLVDEVQEMNEVVVTGYNTIRKSSFTGNATIVTKEELLKTNNKSVISALQVFDPSFRIKENATWGSDPNALPEFNIRGESSIGMQKGLSTESMKQNQRINLKDNPNLPIFILDGFEVSVQKIYDMDMNRIESMTILKDAAATALYGSRAANGVVVVTTTAPKAGEIRVSYNLTTSLELPDLSDYNLCNASEKLEVERLFGVYTSDVPGVQASFDLKYNKLLQEIKRGVNTDWLSQPLRNAFNHGHSVYVEGGVESLRYGIDLNYNSGKGAMKGSFRNRMGAGLSLDYRYKKLQIRNSVSYHSTKSEDSPFGNFSDYARMLPYYKIYDEAGNMIKAYGENDFEANPLYRATLAGFNGKTTYNELIDNLNLNFNILEGLQFKGQFSITKKDSKKEDFIDPKDAQFQGKGIIAKEKGRLDQEFMDGYNWNLNTLLMFNRPVGKHFINATLGINATANSTTTQGMTFQGFQLGSLHSPNYAAQQKDKTITQTSEQRLFGLLASLNYSYNNVYLLDASWRLDGSSQFGADQRFAPFWSVGVGMNLHNYAFLKENPTISLLRVRGSYGSLGKVNFPSYAAISTYQTDESWYYTGPSSALMYLGNPDLKWETTKTLDAGIELGLLQDAIHLKFNYYHKETVDGIDEIHIRTSSGFSTYRSNAGSIVNKGFELDLRSTVFRNDNWIVTVTGNIARNRNEITELSAASEAYNQELNANYDAEYPAYANLQGTPLQQYQKGASTTAIYAVRSAGIDPANGQELYIKKEGGVTHTWCANDQVVVGDLNPDYQGAFGVNVGYKGFYLNLSFMYQWGGQTYNETLIDRVENAEIIGSNVDRRVLTERWRQPGDITPYLDLATNRVIRPTSRFVQDYNYLALNGVSLGYDFDYKMLRKWHLSALGIRLNANDPVRWSSVKEERGTSYPYARNFSLTLNVGF